MKFLTYNIFDGGAGRLDLIISVIKSQSPDILTINEANDFSADNGKIIKEFSEKIGTPHYEIAPTEWGYDVAVFSKTPFIEKEILMSGKRAAVSVVVDSEYGPIAVIGAHLNPGTEDVRLSEIKTIIESQRKYQNRVIMGDLNALSRQDGYSPERVRGFNSKQLQKFTDNGKPHFEVTDELLKSGYHDAAFHLKKNDVTTVPTPSNKDDAHTDLRLDYIFVSESLLGHVSDYEVIKNKVTDEGSDHYPVKMII